MDWIEISVQADGEAAEAVSALFNRFNSRPDGQPGAVTQVDGFDPVGEAHHPVMTVRTYMPAGDPDTPARQRSIEEGLWHLAQIYPLGEPITRQMAEEDWANAWKAHYRPLRIGRRFLVVPAWQTDQVTPGPGDVPLVLDPGMAFGTGLHPSTQLCLTAMEDVIASGQRVLDAGCGSGILSIAAALLGAARVEAFDIDPLAVDATQSNAELNHPPVPIDVFLSSGPGDGPRWITGPDAPRWDVILVNILLPVILEFLRRGLSDYLAPGGRMIFAGVIADQEPQLREALAARSLSVANRLQQGDWVAFVVQAAPQP